MKIHLPNDVQHIIHTLNQNGHQAYAVGGCVRDAILGMTPNDWDITTSALPQEVKRLFPRTIDTGLKHGTVTVMVKGEAYEVTTYRLDGDYLDSRRPTTVEFTKDVLEDLKRRDFTINAMAYNDEDGLIDAFDGIKDLEEKVIRCVGNPVERFTEDALRMLRAIRFSAKLGFTLDDGTAIAIREKAETIKNISAERIHDELTKILISDNPHYMEKVYELGLMEYILPEFIPNIGLNQRNSHHIFTVDRHIYVALLKIEPTETLRWAIFLHDIGKAYNHTIDENGIGHFYGHADKSVQLSEEILSRLRFDNHTKNRILRLIQHHDYRIEPTLPKVRKAIYRIGTDIFEEYLKVRRADIEAQNPEHGLANLEKLDAVKVLYQEVLEKNQCVSLKDLKVNGRDLVTLGIKQGQQIGWILNQLLLDVINDPKLNDYHWLINRAKNLEAKYTKSK